MRRGTWLHTGGVSVSRQDAHSHAAPGAPAGVHGWPAGAVSKNDALQRVTPVPSEHPVAHADRLRLAVAAYLARFKGTSRDHADSDLRCYLAWCAERGLDPFLARRPHLELYIRWMQEVRRFKPATVSRRFSVVAGFYRTCVIDGVLEHSPAEHVRRPAVPAESPTPGFTHLQFEALLTAARESANRNDFALVAMLGLLGLRISRLPARILPTSAKSTATGSCGCAAKAARLSWSAAAIGRKGHRPGHQRPPGQPGPAQRLRHTHGPARCHPAAPKASHREALLCRCPGIVG